MTAFSYMLTTNSLKIHKFMETYSTYTLFQINIDDCYSEACSNGGTCVDLVGGYYCLCPSPFRGENCSKLPCDFPICQNGGVCQNDIMLNSSDSGYYCVCGDRFTG